MLEEARFPVHLPALFDSLNFFANREKEASEGMRSENKKTHTQDERENHGVIVLRDL
ncbi:hypothetical protein GCM10020331_002320 [Ectobacillus funiculus]